MLHATSHRPARFRRIAAAWRLAATLILPAAGVGPGAHAASAEPLPVDIAARLAKAFDGVELRSLHRRVDLDGDGRPEWVVYLVGPMVCGTGGCPLWVFTPQGSTHRAVAQMTVVKTPVRALPAAGPGQWRELVVHVGGGGGPSAEVALAFDGRRYPSNPTVNGPHRRTLDAATVASAEVLVADDFRFEDATPLPTAAGPSFDCRRASKAAERSVCQDPALAALDRELAALYARARAPTRDIGAEDRKAEQATQRQWLSERDACAKRADAGACLADSYRRRIVTLRIWMGDLGPVPPVTGLQCPGAERLPATAVFYADADPKAVVLTLLGRQTIAFIAPSGSGARYAAPGVSYWEHHGEATIEWFGQRFTCKVG